MGKYRVNIGRPDDKAGDERFIVDDAESIEDATQKALDRTDDSWTKVNSVTKIG